jgi:hypothetical protein
MNLYKEYVKGMSLFPPTKIDALKDEWKELLQDKSIEEFFDVVHTMLRMIKSPNWFNFIVAYPTAIKHAKRYESYGCPRSSRNHLKQGEACICKTNK